MDTPITGPNPPTLRDHISPRLHDRRSFIKTLVVGGVTLSFGGSVVRVLSAAEGGAAGYSMILVDFNKCTGCRTCEAVCAQYNHKTVVDGEELPGLGNPYLSNIRAHRFNPDVDVPVVCAMCPDNPCIEACPVEPDEKGRRALYRDPETLAVKNDIERCIGCGSCAAACEAERAGVITPNPETNKPERICTLCDGDPQCVKYCPGGALSLVAVDADAKGYARPPEQVAEELIRQWYSVE